MRFKPERHRHNREWHPHFAWKRVYINCGYPHEHGTIVWLEWVDRKYRGAHGGVHRGHDLGPWHYRLPDSKLPTSEEALIEDPNGRYLPEIEIK